MDNNKLFADYFSQILWFSNTEGGKHLLKKLFKADPPKYPIIGIGSNHVITDVKEKIYIKGRGDTPIYQAKFLGFDGVTELFYPILTKLRIALFSKDDKLFRNILENPYESFLHFAGLENFSRLPKLREIEERLAEFKYPQIYLDTRTFNPNSGGNGVVHIDNGGTWATVHDATTGTAIVNNGNVYASQLTSRSIGRGFLPFNTVALNGGTLIAGSNTVAINITATPGGNAGQLDVFKSTQASNTALVGDDYNNVTFIDGGNVAVANGFTGVKTITLNGTGEGYINFIGGYTPLGIMEDHDVTNTDPNPTDYRFTFDFAGGATPPVL